MTSADPGGMRVLGAALAAARAADERHVPPGRSPIAGISYPAEAHVMWRWVERAEDEVLAAFVRSYVDSDRAGQAVARASLTMNDLYTVLTFARRRAFAAIRTGDTADAALALDAVSAVDVERVDVRDVSVVGALAVFAAQRTGHTPASAIARADPPVAEMLTHAAAGQPRADAVGMWRLVDTADGPVLLTTYFEPFTPTRDLVSPTLSIAAAIDADGSYGPSTVTIGSVLTPGWVGGGWQGGDPARPVTAAVRRLTGCLSIHADAVGHPSFTHSLLVYIAEAATAADAALIVAGADIGGGTGDTFAFGVAVDRLCAVAVARSLRADTPSIENDASMARFRTMIEPVLTRAAVAG